MACRPWLVSTCKQLTVCGVGIKQDAEGRYCLNDLHKAAGSIKHQQPAKFFEAQHAQDLVSEIGEFAKATVMGRNGGTFVVKELVYAYAMWISPKFHLEVIRSYDRLATEGAAVHLINGCSGQINPSMPKHQSPPPPPPEPVLPA